MRRGDEGSEEEEEEEEERDEDDRRDDDRDRFEEEERDPREYVSPREVLRLVRERIALADARVTTDEDGRFPGDVDDEGREAAATSGGPPTREAMDKLDAELRRIVNSLKTSPQDDAKRQALMNKFKSMISTRFEGVRVAPFGSYVSAFHSAGSDIDISLQIDKNGPWYDEREEAQARRSQRGGVRARRQQRQGRSKRAQLLRKVASELRYRNYRDVQLISKARVPLIKFKDPHTGVACDVCIENDGVYKSAVLGVVADIDQRYRDLVFLVKLWAKHYDVNNAMEGSFNSYSLCLLCMHHLQRRNTPILPPTMMLTLPRPDLVESEQRELEEHERCDDDEFDTWKVSKARVVSDASRDIAAVKYRANKFVDYGKENTETLAELFVSFFAHICAIRKLFRNAVNASTYHGTFVVGSSWQAFKYPVGVEDPFAAGDNVARAVQMRTRDYVLNAFPAACADISRMLHAANATQFTRHLICLLGDKSVPPEVFARFRPTLPMGPSSQPPQVHSVRVPGPNAPRQPLDDGGRVMEVLAQRVSSGHTSPEELLAMLTRQRQTQVELQRAQQQQQQQQPSEQQLLMLQRQQEALRMEEAKRRAAQQQQQQQQQQQRIPVASLFGQQLPQIQPHQQRGAPPPGFGHPMDAPPPLQTPLPSFGVPPPTAGGLGGGVFSSIASGGGGLFRDPPHQAAPTHHHPHAPQMDEISQHFAASMSMMDAGASRPPPLAPPPRAAAAAAAPLFPAVLPRPTSDVVQPLPRTTSGAAIPKPRPRG